MKLKAGITLQGIRPELLIGLMVAEQVYREFNRELVVTSVLDGTHSTTSLHYTGCAADIRTRHLSDPDKPKVRGEIAYRLTRDFDVVLESDHIHLEYQPRKSG